MKKLILLFILLPFTFYAQIDTVFQNKAYTSFYSFKYKEPLIVVYKLYKGGGSCKRDKFYFKSTSKTAHDSDYVHSGYDKGHLANAEDFAYNSTLDELTFRYYNCFPQTPELNRGIWKGLENEIRIISQKDSIIVLTGALYGDIKIKSITVPDTCWKVYYHIKTRTYSQCYLFPNNKKPTITLLDLKDFNAILSRWYDLEVEDIVNSYYRK